MKVFDDIFWSYTKFWYRTRNETLKFYVVIYDTFIISFISDIFFVFILFLLVFFIFLKFEF